VEKRVQLAVRGVNGQNVVAVCGLPPLHKAPFGRMLIAQATVEGLTLVSRDAEIARFASSRLRVY
jgi:PIN domain nuclease of toxin-antitoxin system